MKKYPYFLLYGLIFSSSCRIEIFLHREAIMLIIRFLRIYRFSAYNTDRDSPQGFPPR